MTFFTRRRREFLNVYYISQSYFDIPRRSIGNNSDRLILFKQTLRDVESMYKFIGGYDMKYYENTEMCRKAWENDYDYLQTDRFARIGEGRYTISNCNKTTYLEGTPETKPFWFIYMLYSIKETEDSENLNELVSLESQVKAVRLQDKLGKQNFHEDMKKVFEPVTKSHKDVSEEVTKTITESSIENNKAIEKLKSKLLEIMNDRGINSSYLLISFI